jgi:hypothetical protein
MIKHERIRIYAEVLSQMSIDGIHARERREAAERLRTTVGAEHPILANAVVAFSRVIEARAGLLELWREEDELFADRLQSLLDTLPSEPDPK